MSFFNFALLNIYYLPETTENQKWGNFCPSEGVFLFFLEYLSTHWEKLVFEFWIEYELRTYISLHT